MISTIGTYLLVLFASFLTVLAGSILWAFIYLMFKAVREFKLNEHD
ncbi:hypothetical protein GHU05_07075 [Fructobacillus tropaeoli]|nr:hypothetical protein [Fructobacillus tropaeoli]NLS38682.1 hypothetical protein [Fructobacillus tropaeoli]